MADLFNYEDWYCFTVCYEGDEENTDAFFFYTKNAHEFSGYLEFFDEEPDFFGDNVHHETFQADLVHIYYNRGTGNNHSIFEGKHEFSPQDRQIKWTLRCYQPSPYRACNIRDTRYNLSMTPDANTFKEPHDPYFDRIKYQIQWMLFPRLSTLQTLRYLTDDIGTYAEMWNNFMAIEIYRHYDAQGRVIAPSYTFRLCKGRVGQYIKHHQKLFSYISYDLELPFERFVDIVDAMCRN